MNYAELELTLSRRDGERYAAELRYSQPGSDADIRLMRDAALLRIDHAQLAGLAFEPAEYGRALGQAIFADESLRAQFAVAYPGAWKRISARREFMRDSLGINLHEDVLPFSNIPAYLPPYLLAPHRAMTVA